MKYLSTLAYVIYIILIISLLFIITHPTPVIAEGIEPVKTLESEINRLSTKYSVDKNLAFAILNCESNLNPNAINVNKNKTIDYSYWQINNYYWSKELSSLGFDITNPEQNLEAGFYLLNKYGSGLWIWSKPCWSK
jgi:soluble lytic murein transglycosylase-like protein